MEWTYNSNGIEGNTLMLRETQIVLEGKKIKKAGYLCSNHNCLANTICGEDFLKLQLMI